MKKAVFIEPQRATERRDLFVISDVHGHAGQLFAALDEAGFDRNDPRHLLVCCGDYFDRGRESRAVYRYLRATPNKILLRGNHEYLLEEALARKIMRPIDARNGMERTLASLFGRDCLDLNTGRIYADPEDAADILRFTADMYDYFESAHHRFVHGWVPLAIDGEGVASPHARWQTATRSEWRRASWTEWQQLYSAEGLRPCDRTLVCGHRTAAYGACFDPSRRDNDFSTFHGNGVIALDAQTVSSGRVNVLVLRDEEIDLPITHEMRLRREPFEAIRSGEKRVEMRVYDEKRRALRPRDRIRFTCEESGEVLTAEVLGIHVYPDFAALAEDFETAELGFPMLTREQITHLMATFYPDARVRSYGAAAIRLKV